MSHLNFSQYVWSQSSLECVKIQTDKILVYSKPGAVVFEMKSKSIKMVDMAGLFDNCFTEKEEKVDKYETGIEDEQKLWVDCDHRSCQGSRYYL